MAEPFIEEKTRKVALLIDGDNAQPSLIDKILAEAGKYGLVTIRRIYGDWTTVNMSGWKTPSTTTPSSRSSSSATPSARTPPTAP